MRYSSFAALAAIAQLSLASPVQRLDRRQDIDFDAYNAVPTLTDVGAPMGDPTPTSTTTYDASSVQSSAAAAITSAAASDDSDDSDDSTNLIQKRTACATNSPGTGPVVNSPDTPAAFQSYSAFAAAASNAVTPAAFTQVAVNSLGSAQDATYMTYKTLATYDPSLCAAFCEHNAGCNSFNIFFERDPSVTPGAGCDNPSSVTYIKCSIFGGVLPAKKLTNVGGWQDNFHVVIAGSNLYNLAAPPAQPGFTGPVYFNNASINAPSGYMGVQTFPQTQPYDPSVCAAACNAKTAFDIQVGIPSAANPDKCEFFVAYILYKNNGGGVFTCTYYTSAWDSTYAVNTGQYDSAGNHYTIGFSNGYALDGAPVDGVSASS